LGHLDLVGVIIINLVRSVPPPWRRALVFFEGSQCEKSVLEMVENPDRSMDGIFLSFLRGGFVVCGNF